MTLTTTEVLNLLADHPEARIHSEKGGYLLTWPNGPQWLVLDEEFNQLKDQSYIEQDEELWGQTVYRISEDGRKALQPRPG